MKGATVCLRQMYLTIQIYLIKRLMQAGCENVITNNIANIDTPGYKRQDVDFESVLQKALGKTKYSSLDKKVRELNQDLGKLTTTSYTDAANYSYRLDRNNVDENTENAELASESLRYQLLTTAITNNFSRMQTVLK